MSQVAGMGTGICAGKMGLMREVEGRGLLKKEGRFVGQQPKSPSLRARVSCSSIDETKELMYSLGSSTA